MPAQPDPTNEGQIDFSAEFGTLGALAHDFDFGRALPSASFPPEFVETYIGLATHDPVDYDGERVYFAAPFSNRMRCCWFDGIFRPDTITAQNGIISESNYAESGATIMPPGYYAIGSAYDEIMELRLLLCLDESSLHYGHLFAWQLAWDALGTEDNTGGLAFLANTLDQFLDGLTTQAEVEDQIAAIDKSSNS